MKSAPLLKKTAGGGIGEEIRASTDMVVSKEFLRFLLAKILYWIGPENVAHQTMGRRLPEPIDL